MYTLFGLPVRLLSCCSVGCSTKRIMNETTDERPAVLVATEKDAAQKDKGVKECTGGGANGGGAG